MTAQQTPSGLQIGLLGPLTVTADGRQVQLAGRRAAALLAVLAGQPGSPVGPDALVEAVWSDAPEVASGSALQQAVQDLQEALGHYSGVVSETDAGYQLGGEDPVPGPVTLDTGEAQTLVDRARAAVAAGDHIGAAQGFRRALQVWRGSYCAGLADLAALGPARTYWDGLRTEVLESRIDADLRVHAPSLVPELEAHLAEHPQRERLWGQLILALYRDGRQADALAAYQRARSVLGESGGVEPSGTLRQLETELREQSAAGDNPQAGSGLVAGYGGAALIWLDAAGRPHSQALTGASRLVIGRDPRADVALPWDSAASRRHAQIEVAAGRLAISDLASLNGTWQNGAVRRGSADGTGAHHALHDGDLIRCGDTPLFVQQSAGRHGLRDAPPMNAMTRRIDTIRDQPG